MSPDYARTGSVLKNDSRSGPTRRAGVTGGFARIWVGEAFEWFGDEFQTGLGLDELKRFFGGAGKS